MEGAPRKRDRWASSSESEDDARGRRKRKGKKDRKKGTAGHEAAAGALGEGHCDGLPAVSAPPGHDAGGDEWAPALPPSSAVGYGDSEAGAVLGATGAPGASSGEAAAALASASAPADRSGGGPADGSGDDGDGDGDGGVGAVGGTLRHIPLLHGCRRLRDAYDLEGVIDEGAYGVVHAARDRTTGDRVALKQVKMATASVEEGFPITALRETNMLLALDHPNIIRVREMVVDGGAGASSPRGGAGAGAGAGAAPTGSGGGATGGGARGRGDGAGDGDGDGGVFMVMDLMDIDLKTFIRAQDAPFSQGEVKSMLRELLLATACMHEHWYVHRDIKSSNVLVDAHGSIRLCDMGLARKYGSPIGPATPGVCTLHCRAPELLLGARVYGPEIDVWSVGCVFGELILRRPLLPGSTEAHQLDLIFRAVGSPNQRSWPGFASLPMAHSIKWKTWPAGRLRLLFEEYGVARNALAAGSGAYLPDSGLDLLQRMLTLDPARRITAAEALAHPYWREAPSISRPAGPTPGMRESTDKDRSPLEEWRALFENR